MGVIDQYWTGVLQRLQAEVEVFNRLIAHQGERGRENELALARVLEGLLPGRLGVGTGLLFDSTGKYSKQMDVVLYDQIDSPTVLAQTTQMLYPVEDAHLVIEVKSRLDKAGIDDTAKKRGSIAALTVAHGHRYPAFALFAYDAAVSPETVGANLTGFDQARRPDLTCVLDPGLLAGPRRLLHPGCDDDTYVHGVTLLHELDGQGHRQAGHYVAADPAGPQDRQQRNGVVYPVVDFGGRAVLSDPSRALLLFCEALVRLLADRDGRPAPVMGHYLPAPYRDIEVVD